MVLKSFWHAIQASALGDYVASSTVAFPLLESIHVIAIVTVFGTVAIMDLRLVGLASRNVAVTSLSRDTLRITWGAFVIAAFTGTLLFISKATSYTVNPYFQWKMILILLAGVNMALFHVVTSRGPLSVGAGKDAGRAGMIAGGLSLIVWILVIFCGRVIGFTLGVYT